MGAGHGSVTIPAGAAQTGVGEGSPGGGRGPADGAASMRSRESSEASTEVEDLEADSSEEQHEEVFDIRLLLWEDREEQRLEDLRAAAEKLGRVDPGEFGVAIARAEAAGVARWKISAARRLHGRLLRATARGPHGAGGGPKAHGAPMLDSPWYCFSQPRQPVQSSGRSFLI